MNFTALKAAKEIYSMSDLLFQEQAWAYAKYRPRYPPLLLVFLKNLCNNRFLAWDSGTGNGQAAISLAEFFDAVYATDISATQIEHAFRHPKVQYKVEAAEKCALEDCSADLVTAGTAAHWFDTTAYFKQADRVLKQNGVLALWSYSNCKISPAVDDVVNKYLKIVSGYWDTRIQQNFDHYKNQPFPYPLIKTPNFFIEQEYTLSDFFNYLFTWSATQTYIKEQGENPLESLKTELINAWEDAQKRKVIWRLFLKVGRKTGA